MSQTPPKIPVWNCQAEVSADVTVGQKFSLGCSGESVPLLKTDQVVIYTRELDPVTKHASLNNLKILEVQSIDDRHFQATVTSYLTGKYQDDNIFVLTDGTNEIALQNIKFNVASVMQKGQEQKPYPAYPPWIMPIPLWFIALIIMAVIVPAVGIWLIFKRQKQKRALIESLKKQKTARLPFDEFHRDIRLIEKKHGLEPHDPKGYIGDLEKSFRLYLIRELIVPANDWSDRAILNEIKSQHKTVWSASERGLKRLLKEFERARRANAVSVTDSRQLYSMCLEVSEDIFKVIAAKNKRSHL